MRKRYSWFFTEVNLLICLSKYWEKQIQKTFPEAKTRVIPNAIPISSQLHPRVFSAHPLRLAFLGRIVQRKGLFDLLEVIAELKSQGIDVHLEIGGDGEVAYLKRTLQKLGLAQQVQYLGWIGTNEKESLFRRVDAYVLPSYAEGMPMSVLEAMAHGLPVVSTNVGGIPDLIDHDITGLLISPGDKVALHSAIKRLVLDPKLIIRLGEKAYERVMEHNKMDTMTKRLINLYNDLTSL